MHACQLTKENQTKYLNSDVSKFLDEQKLLFRNEIELLRNYILTANNELTENLKWNGTSYCFDKEDRITMRVQSTTVVSLAGQLIIRTFEVS